MIYNIAYNELTSKINPIVFSKYLEDTGWNKCAIKRKDVRVFQKEEPSFFQINLPMDESLLDYNAAIYEACKTTAKCENRPIDQVILSLLNPNADVLKIRIEKKEVEAGNILLDDAIDVYENAKKLLGATAQDVLKPSVIHRGRIDTAVTDFLSNCRFGQTEVGSYIVSIICPMTEMKTGEIEQLDFFDEDSDKVNFTRQITTKLIRNLQTLKERIDNGQYNLADTSNNDGISVNFYEALIGLNLKDEGVKIDFLPEWSPNLPVPDSIPKKISLSHNYYHSIYSTITTLKGKVKRKKNIVGRIKKLESTPDLENRKAGKISVVYVDDNNKAKTVTAMLEKNDYDRAIEAHTKGWYVELMGEISGNHGETIDCESFNVI